MDLFAWGRQYCGGQRQWLTLTTWFESAELWRMPASVAGWHAALAIVIFDEQSCDPLVFSRNMRATLEIRARADASVKSSHSYQTGVFG